MTYILYFSIIGDVVYTNSVVVCVFDVVGYGNNVAGYITLPVGITFYMIRYGLIIWYPPKNVIFAVQIQ